MGSGRKYRGEQVSLGEPDKSATRIQMHETVLLAAVIALSTYEVVY